MRVVIVATVMRVLELSDGGSVDVGNFFFDIGVIGVICDIFLLIRVVRHCFLVVPVVYGWLRCVFSVLVVVCSVRMWMSVSGASPGVPSVVELGSSASEDVSAGTYHVGSEGELLAVEDEEVAVLIDVVLAPAALSLEAEPE